MTSAMRPVLLVSLLFLAAAAMAWRELSAQLPLATWAGALFAPDVDSPRQMLLYYTVFPRMAVALMSGAARRSA